MNLIEGRENIVSELDFCNCSHPHRGEPNPEGCDSLFAERSVEDSWGSELLVQVQGASEDSSELHVLPEEQGPIETLKA